PPSLGDAFSRPRLKYICPYGTTFLYYTPVFYKCIMFFLLFYTFVAFTVLSTKILSLFVNLTLKLNALFLAIFNLTSFFWLVLVSSNIFSLSSLDRHSRLLFLRRAL